MNLMSTHNIYFYGDMEKIIPKLSFLPFVTFYIVQYIKCYSSKFAS